jgi:hypothetical protein
VDHRILAHHQLRSFEIHTWSEVCSRQQRFLHDDALFRGADIHRLVNIGAGCLNLLRRSYGAQINAWIAVAQRPCSRDQRTCN